MRNADAPSPWKAYRESIGDRSPLFAEIASVWGVADALYPGSYVDLSPSSAIRSVTYVDTDKRAAGYFRDADRVQADLAEAASGAGNVVEFIGFDYPRQRTRNRVHAVRLRGPLTRSAYAYVFRRLSPRGSVQP